MEQEVGQGAIQQPTDQDGTPKRKPKNEIFEWIKAIVIALVLVFLIRWFLFKPFIVDGPSMQPNFHTGERVIVNEILYDFRSPKPGEVIVFHVPDEGRDFIKRVIAVEGDTVKVEGDTITVNGKPIQEPYLKTPLEAAHQNGELYNKFTNFPLDNFMDGKVQARHIFAMGDNRSNSPDSRLMGYLDRNRVV
ncbi:signal peptidase I [Paenibacillus sp. 28ISP30-2]|nr:signal peptidase I [Paenibacillus sp. 28ISP30-2]